MNYVHRPLDVGADELVEVTLDNPANVQLLDDDNYASYRAGRPYHYHGGFASGSIYTIRPPRPGRWHLVIDLGGYAGRVRSWVRIVPGGQAVGAS